VTLRAILEDANAIAHPIRECTSTTRPTAFRKGRVISETDTGLLYVNSGTFDTPAWTPVTSEASVRASTTQYGSTRLSTPPAVTNEPIALGENDSRFVTVQSHTAIVSGNPHGTTPAMIGAAVQADLDVLADAQADHDADPTKHVIVGTTAERTALGDPGVDGVLFLDTDIGRFYWWDDTSNEWDTAPTSPAPSYFELADIPDEFDPEPHASDHAEGGPDELTPAEIGALPDNIVLGEGAGIDLSTTNLADGPIISIATVDPSPAGTYSNANVTVDAQGRVTAAESGSTSGVPNASEDDPGIVYLSSDPPAGESPVVVRVGDSVASGFVPNTLLLGASEPLEVVGVGASADLSTNRTLGLKGASLTNAYVQAGSSFVRDVADITARNAIPSVKRGQLVYVASNQAVYKSTSPDGTAGGSVSWADVASGASAATDEDQ
jgi:hypothetical protein